MGEAVIPASYSAFVTLPPFTVQAFSLGVSAILN